MTKHTVFCRQARCGDRRSGTTATAGAEVDDPVSPVSLLPGGYELLDSSSGNGRMPDGTRRRGSVSGNRLVVRTVITASS